MRIATGKAKRTYARGVSIVKFVRRALRRNGPARSIRAALRRVIRLATVRDGRRFAARDRFARGRLSRTDPWHDFKRVFRHTHPKPQRGMIAVNAALRQVGDPYVWGAAGPNAFDCSGLTQWAWGHAGVSLDHFTGSQWNQGRHVSRNALKPGDLVFFHADLGHVGLYVGGGRMVVAPHAGARVRVDPVNWGSYVGAVRPWPR